MKTKWIVAFALALVVNGLTSGVTIAQTQHQNGLGQSYVDPADPLGTPGNAGTYNVNMATLAATAWQQPGPEKSSSGQCGRGGPTPSQAVTKQTATSCAVWAFTGALAGHVHLNQANTCVCPSPSDPAWN
jgi:hypothetical protein